MAQMEAQEKASAHMFLKEPVHVRDAMGTKTPWTSLTLGLIDAEGRCIARYPEGETSPIIMHLMLLKFPVFVQFHHFILIRGVMLLFTAYIRFIEYLLLTVSIIYASI